MHAGPVTAPSPGVAPGSRLPIHALVLARRVRALVATTLVHTTVTAALGWWAGRGVTLPGLGSFAAHVAVQLGAVLPIRWQFAGDPVTRQGRAVRAMALSFGLLATYSLVDGVLDALAPPVPGEPVVGALLGLAAMAALPVLLALEARTEVRLEEGGLAAPPARSTVLVLEAVLAVGVVSDLAAGTAISGPTVSVVVAVLAAREALGAARL